MIVEYCLMFDVDGVLTDPVRKEVTILTGLEEIADRLRRGQPIVLNTGRAVDFVQEKIVTHLEKMFVDKTPFQNMVVIGEKGAVIMQFDHEGKGLLSVDETISVPTQIQTSARSIVENQFKNSMFFDETKRTMVSIEMHDGYNLENFQAEQQKLIPVLEKLVASASALTKLNVDPTTIATDVQSATVGKAFGARRALAWLEEKKIEPKEFVTFGDSQSDLPMAEELVRLNKRTRFVFVGEPEKLNVDNARFPIIKTNNRYEQGVGEFLKQF